MNDEQAIERLKDLIEDRKSFFEEDGIGDEIYRVDVEALKIAIEALEKQLPRKSPYISDEETLFECPVCKGWINYGYGMTDHKYCLRCGQRLDWRG